MNTKVATAVGIALFLLVTSFLVWDAYGDGEQMNLEDQDVAIASKDNGTVQRTTGKDDEDLERNASGSTTDEFAEKPEETPATEETRLQFVWKSDGQPAINMPIRLDPVGRSYSFGFIQTVQTDSAGFLALDSSRKERIRVLCEATQPELLATIDPDTKGTTKIEIPGDLEVRGSVVDQEGSPIANAEVLVGRLYSLGRGFVVARSDETGKFVLHHVSRSHSIAARHPQYAPSGFIQFGAAKEESPNLTVVLSAAFARVKGKVVDDRGWPVAKAMVKVGSTDLKGTSDEKGYVLCNPPATLVLTDAQGAFDTGPLQPGRVRVIVDAGKETLGRYVKNFQIAPGSTRQLNIKLEAPAILHGIVRDETGKTLSGVSLSFGYSDADVRSFSTVSDTQGAYELKVGETGQIHARATWRMFIGIQDILVVTPGERKEWNPIITMGSRISGRIVCPENVSIQNWSVMAKETKNISPFWQQFVFSNDKGAFEFRNCPQGEIKLTFSHSQFSSGLPAQIKLVKGGDENIVITFKQDDLPSAHLTGKVVGPNGTRPSGITLTIRREGGNSGRSHAVKSADGSFDIGPLAAGDYHVDFEAQVFGKMRLGPISLAAVQPHDLGNVAFREPGRLILKFDYPPEDLKSLTYVDVYSASGDSTQVILEMQEERAFRLTPGIYTIALNQGSKPPKKQQVEVLSGSTTRLTLKIESP